jgi:hypothetical protein
MNLVEMNTHDHHTLYKYSTLLSESSFRILELLPGDQDDEIAYNLETSEIGTSRPYEALSYCWGDPTDQLDTNCHSRTLKITQNLHAGLKALRSRTGSRWLWADAICIDQGNTQERSVQVRRMLDIYRNAARVVVWLGPDEGLESGGSMAEAAKSLINDFTVEVARNSHKKLWQNPRALWP